MVDMKRVQALVPSGTGITARLWPFDRSNPVLVVGLMLMPKAFLELPEGVSRWDEYASFGEYTRFHGLNGCTGGEAARVRFSIDGELCIDEEVDMVVGNRLMHCLPRPVLLSRFSEVVCEFSHKELDEILCPIIFCVSALQAVASTESPR